MFDYKKFSKILTDKNIKTETLSKKLVEDNGYEALKSLRKGNVKNPKYSLLINIADICGVSYFDFFHNGEIEKEKIIINELKRPSDKIKEIIKNYNNLEFIKRDIIANGNNGHTINTTHSKLSSKEETLLEFFRESDPQTQKELFAMLVSHQTKGIGKAN